MRQRSLREAWFSPLGLALRLRTDHPAVVATAMEAFGGFGIPGIPGIREPAPGAPDLDFLFLARHGKDRERETLYRDTGGRVQLCFGGSLLAVDRARGRARARLSPGLLTQPALLRLEVLELALQLMLPARGFFGVHGAAVVRHGRAALLRAPGGGGKTTLALAAARGGFQVLAEDVVWIAPDRRTWWGLPWWLHPRPESVALFPELVKYSPALWRSGGPKLAVPFEALHPGSTVPRALPGPVVLLERVPEGPRHLSPLSLAEARSLWRLGRAGTEEEVPNYEQEVSNLLRDNAWRLAIADLPSALAALDRLLQAGPPKP